MIRFNLSGLIMFLVAALVGTIASLILGNNGILVAVGVLIPLDLVYRWRSSEEGWAKWLAGNTGGFLGITPAWMTGLILLGIHFSGWLDLA